MLCLRCLVICVVVLVSSSFLVGYEMPSKRNGVCDFPANSCHETRPAKNVTLVANNWLRPPNYFQKKVFLKETYSYYLIHMMEAAVDIDTGFRFTVTYFSRKLGYFVDAINGTFGNYSLDKSYWKIMDSSLKPIPCGVSFYVPADGETVTFNLTQQ